MDDPTIPTARDEITARATTWLGNWPRPDPTVFVPTEGDDDPDEE